MTTSAPVRKLRTRELVPRSEFPNFRDHGRMVDRPLLNVLASLQRRYGESFASEAGLRRMIAQDVKHMPGVDTIRRALERLEAQGILAQEWLTPGGIMPDGSPCTFGTRLVRLAINRRERFAFRARARRRNRREGVSHRIVRRELGDAHKHIAAAVSGGETPPEREAAAGRKRESDLARLAELAAEWDTGPPE